MPFSQKLLLTQCSLGVAADVFNVDVDTIFVDQTFIGMFNATDIQMVKLSLSMEKALGKELDPIGIGKRMSINDLVDHLMPQIYPHQAIA